MTSSPSPFANTGKLHVLPNSTTLMFTQPINNSVTINNVNNTAQHIRQTSINNGNVLSQQSMGGGIVAPTNIVRINQPQSIHQNPHTIQSQVQYTPQTLWANPMQQSQQQQQQQQQQQFTLQKATPQSPTVHYTTVKSEPGTPIHHQIQQPQQPSSMVPAKVVTQAVVRQPVGTPPSVVYTESQINDFVSKCRTFLTTLLRLAEKQAPEKLPMVRSCIQELLDGTIDPELFTQRLHTLYKSQPHTSLVPFFKLALPHMRQIVKKIYGRPITIELLEKLHLPSSNNANSMLSTTNTAPPQLTNPGVVVNPSLLSQQQHGSSSLPQPLHTTVQPQQKINLLQQNTQPTLIGTTASLLSQQQQQQQQARAQISLTAGRPLLTSISTTGTTSLLSAQQHQQHGTPVAQMIIQSSDPVIQRSILTSTSSNALQQPQIITVNPQLIKTETTTHPQPSPLSTMASIQQRNMIKTEDDHGHEHNYSNQADSRHLTQDSRLISSQNLRRRLHDIAEKEKRTGIMESTDDAALALVSHAAQERLKYLIEQVKLIAQHRIDISMKNNSAYQSTSDVKSQLRFLEELDKIEKQKKDKLEQEKIFRAAKSRSKTNDPEAAKLKQKAKEMQLAQVEEQRQKEANETALAAIGKPKKRKLEESTNQVHSSHPVNSNGADQISPIQPSPSSAVTTTNLNSKSKAAKRICRANLRDLLLIMERDKYLKRSTLLVKALNK